MKRSLIVAALAGVALVSLPFEARAQVSTVVKPVQFGIAAGVAIPTSDLSDFASTGFNGTVMVGLNPAMIPLGIRIDGAYNQFSLKDAFGDGDVKIISVTGNFVYKFAGVNFSPYAIGGAGLYNADLEVPGFPTESENKFGWNLGGGISLPLSGFDTFIEARYHQVQTDTPVKFVPITFGIMF